MVDCAALVVSKERKRLMFFKRFTAAGVITAVSNVVPLKLVIQQEGKWCVCMSACACVSVCTQGDFVGSEKKKRER